MKYELPSSHGLSIKCLDSLIPKDGDSISLTDVQFEALDKGVARNKSMLVVAPTSTGKTMIGIWAVASGLEAMCNTVYLVTHRALARQKFEVFTNVFLSTFLDDVSESIVLATGDTVVNTEGNIPSDPLHAPVIVATYEKYLAMLAASGIPKNLSRTVFVCDEIQLLGDKYRGQNVELLLTLLKRAGWKQLVGLSAVLDRRDAFEISLWLEIDPVINLTREKHLSYECWTSEGIYSHNTGHDEDDIHQQSLPVNLSLDTLAILQKLIKEKAAKPIIVFCMTKKRTYELAQAYTDLKSNTLLKQLSFLFGNLSETNANSLLTSYIPNKYLITY